MAFTTAQGRRRRGPWIFMAALLLFWGGLGLTGLKVLKPRYRSDPAFVLDAQDIAGLTRLQIVQGADAGGYRRSVDVLVGTGQGIEARTYPLGQTATDADDGAHRLGVFREGNTLVIIAAQEPAAQSPGHRRRWSRLHSVTVPAQFRHLVVTEADIHAVEPLAELRVDGVAVRVSGNVASLDLRAAQADCSDCSTSKGGRNGPEMPVCDPARPSESKVALRVDASAMREVVMSAATGSVALTKSAGLQRLRLLIGNDVGVSVDRAHVLLPGAKPVLGAGARPLLGDSACVSPLSGALEQSKPPARQALYWKPLS
ncbi:hypothetical protein CLU88_3655 [Acidovorax sp. 56]|uniref:hypothetical protein n=1 Tax=Acidovorax sp. 56 TaxID=2035205 RepID=UPI000C16FF4E|nr:hypothetical protein [Acidovorax sp. 56]PIF28739.1 hypothetical protein CLU88_3655 [Acidovorax sp. 56]